MESSPSPPEQMVPVAQQPRGAGFFLGTWTGRIILLNTIVFVAMAWESGNISMPTPEVLMHFGAKDPVLLAEGQYWRLITPIFVHIGLIHFAFNTWALYILAYQIEHLLRGRWFLVLYLLSGFTGNVASAVFSVAVSAGASSSLFGVLGAGFFIERVISKNVQKETGRKTKTGAYTVMVVANVALGMMIPQIDNAAHLGGLVGGIFFSYALFAMIPNRIRPRKPVRGILALSVLAVFLVAGTGLGTSPSYLYQRLVEKAVAATNPIEQYHYYSEALRLEPGNPRLLFERGKVLLLAGYPKDSLLDFQQAAQKSSEALTWIAELHRDLIQDGRERDAQVLAPFVPK